MRLAVGRLAGEPVTMVADPPVDRVLKGPHPRDPVTVMTAVRTHLAALRMLLVLTVVFGLGYPLAATGVAALLSNTTGLENTANGYAALQGNTTGDSNAANGSYALQRNTTGSSNTANGYYALQSNANGDGNTAHGVYALRSNRSGGDNTAAKD